MTTQEALRLYKKIAVIGLSPNPDRPSHYVSEYMIEHGYDVVGVNPGQAEILDRPVYPKLSDVPDPLEIVAVFRASEYLPEIVEEVIRRKPKVLWIQLGIHDPDAEAKAEKNGIEVVRQRCLMVEHQGLRR
jgi:predicted CoA-binding protein